MKVTLRCVGGEHDGRLLESYDPDWTPAGYDGPLCGLATWTDDPSKAMVFATAGAAMTAWRATSVRSPVRADGRPNRPLTAYTVEVANL